MFTKPLSCPESRLTKARCSKHTFRPLASLGRWGLLWLEYEMALQAHVLEAWLPTGGLLGSDWVLRALT
jgi:hypothetical protein